MTQEELAEKLGYKTKSTITKIECGINDPVLSRVSAFAEALNTTVSYFMNWDESPSYNKGLIDAELLKKIRQLSAEDKADVNKYFDFILSRKTEETK
jgi:transcriptional regulator with XRE-family HTH domain